MSAVKFSFDVNFEKYLVLLLVVVIVLLSSHLLLGYIHYNVQEVPWLLMQLFHLDEENNIPTWFSSLLLLNVSFFLLLKSQSALAYNNHWRLIAIGFLILSLDEVAGLHETLNTYIDMSWVYPAIVLLCIVGLFFVSFALSLARFLLVGFLLSGLVFFGGAIGVELLAADMDEETFAYIIATAIEEGMEMLGACMFLYMSQKALSHTSK